MSLGESGFLLEFSYTDARFDSDSVLRWLKSG